MLNIMSFFGWSVWGVVLVSCAAFVVLGWVLSASSKTKAVLSIASACVVVATFFGLRWYYTNTASGQRAIVDAKSDIANGMERTVTVYTANGDVMAVYHGKIDIEANAGGYLKFDFDGNRYIYYNCFVESVAEIK